MRLRNIPYAAFKRILDTRQKFNGFVAWFYAVSGKKPTEPACFPASRFAFYGTIVVDCEKITAESD